MELLPFLNPSGHSDGPLLNMASHKSPQSSLFHSARRASLYPSVINEPILEEDNKDDTEVTEGACLSILYSQNITCSPGLWLLLLLLLPFNQQ